jgi:hypothetical protein
VDAFASIGNNIVTTYWLQQDDALSQYWRQEYLWMIPLFSQKEIELQKILGDEAR